MYVHTVCMEWHTEPSASNPPTPECGLVTFDLSTERTSNVRTAELRTETVISTDAHTHGKSESHTRTRDVNVHDDDDNDDDKCTIFGVYPALRPHPEA